MSPIRCRPREVGYFIPEPVAGKSAPQSNDVALDARGLIYIVDRHVGFDMLEFEGVRSNFSNSNRILVLTT